MLFKSKHMKVHVVKFEADHLDKWASMLNAKKVRETARYDGGVIEKIYVFPNSKLRAEFLDVIIQKFSTLAVLP